MNLCVCVCVYVLYQITLINQLYDNCAVSVCERVRARQKTCDQVALLCCATSAVCCWVRVPFDRTISASPENRDGHVDLHQNKKTKCDRNNTQTFYEIMFKVYQH